VLWVRITIALRPVFGERLTLLKSPARLIRFLGWAGLLCLWRIDVYFRYGKKETSYLKKNDPILGRAIDVIGQIRREVDNDLFSSVVHTIVSQQISSAAKQTVWNRLTTKLNDQVIPVSVNQLGRDELQGCGISFRKTDAIKEFAAKIVDGRFDLEGLTKLGDEEVVKQLSSLKGIGRWSAEMLMLFAMQRPDIISFGDLGILRGMRFLYGYEKIDRSLFNRHAEIYSPYGSVASLYLWAMATGDYQVDLATRR